MQRFTQEQLSEILTCVECGESRLAVENELMCTFCGAHFAGLRGGPVMMRTDNQLFPKSAYVSTDGDRTPAKRTGVKKWVKDFVPSRAVNLARERIFAHLAAEHDCYKATIFVVGCGNQTTQLARYFVGGACFVFTDIDKGADTDLFCDAHHPPFSGQRFDGVISTAVKEHVMQPVRVI